MPRKSETEAANRLLDISSANWRRLPGFVLTSSQDTAKGTIVTTTTVRNDSEGQHFVRMETALQLPRTPPKATVHIVNGEGLWQLYENHAIRFGFPMTIERSVPVRLATARNLRLQQHQKPDDEHDIVYTVESDSEFFGLPCTKVTISLAPPLMTRLLNPEDPWRKAIAARAMSDLGAGTDAKKKTVESALELAEARYPVSYVYYIEKTHQFIVSWQGFSYSGKKINDVSFQDFQVKPEPADSLFEIPKDYPVVNVANINEYNSALKRMN